MTILAGVIGDPIGHSRSPTLHGTWLRRHNIEGQYVPLHVRADDLEATLRLLPRLGFAGINVTIPHKEAVFQMADTVTERARAVGAANTLTFTEGKIHADNTDGYGFTANLQQGAPDWTPDLPAIVLGAGGAARGVIAALLAAGVPSVTLANRTRSRAEDLAGLFTTSVHVVDWDNLGDRMAGHGLLVNTTSLGMTGQPALEVDLSTLPRSAVVTDIVYTPVDTPLLVQARAAGHVTVDGVGMLLHQAVPGFSAWFNVTPTVDDDLRQAVLG